ncbi:MAG: ATP-grasp domain-containing protein, partial [Gammaproteobacteria bacterium]|nr:ATP-grasp domain-containing protein [Gammaproteobacteria bacterium]
MESINKPASRKRDKTLVLFSYDWDAIEFDRLAPRWPQLKSGFDLFSFPSNARLAWFDIERFCTLAATRARLFGARGVVSNHEQFGALSAALLAEKAGWPGTPVEAVLACQHKLYAREVLERVAPEANVPYRRLDAEYGGDIPGGIAYPTFVKPVKAAFSVLAKNVRSHDDLHAHTRFGPWELWVIRHLVEPFERILRQRLPHAGTAHSLMLERPLRGGQYSLDGYFHDGQYHGIGIVDAIMYPGTDAFMRFDYPSRLPGPLRSKAEQVAVRFLKAVGFKHGLFNMEFIHDDETGEIKVIEFNPRMASQFSDLYARVDGIDLHEMALALGQGLDPAVLPVREPSAGCASSFVYRSFDPSAAIAMPGKRQLAAFHSLFGDALLFQFPKLPGQVQRDFKWLGSYRYGIMHLGGKDPHD